MLKHLPNIVSKSLKVTKIYDVLGPMYVRTYLCFVLMETVHLDVSDTFSLPGRPETLICVFTKIKRK